MMLFKAKYVLILVHSHVVLALRFKAIVRNFLKILAGHNFSAFCGKAIVKVLGVVRIVCRCQYGK